MFYNLVIRYPISVDQFFFPNRNAEKSTGRRQLDALLDGMSDKGIRIVTATAREITEVEQAEDKPHNMENREIAAHRDCHLFLRPKSKENPTYPLPYPFGMGASFSNITEYHSAKFLAENKCHITFAAQNNEPDHRFYKFNH